MILLFERAERYNSNQRAAISHSKTLFCFMGGEGFGSKDKVGLRDGQDFSLPQVTIV